MKTLTDVKRAPVSGGKPKQLVIFLHGLGANANDLISLADEFSDFLPDAQFISPNAPFACDMAPTGYQWFSLQSWDETDIISGVREATPILNDYIDTNLAKYNLTDRDLALVGFSQGTIMSLHAGLRRSHPCAAILGYSGSLIAPALLEKEIVSKPKVLLIHGDQDTVIPVAALDIAYHALKSRDVPVSQLVCRGLGHGIDMLGIEKGRSFLKECFAHASAS